VQPLGAARNYFEPRWLREEKHQQLEAAIAEAYQVTTRSVLSSKPTLTPT
jgi:hypothetical protein